MEKIFEVKPIGVKYICDKCNTGEMLPTGKMKMLETHPLFPHICNKCEEELDLTEKYPVVRYKTITN